MMRTLSYKLKEKTSTADYKKILRHGTRFFFILSGVLFLGYLYCVGAVTFTVIHRRGMEQEVKLMTSAISQQELSFLQTQKNLTKEYAYTRGYVDPAQLAFTQTKRAVAWNAGR